MEADRSPIGVPQEHEVVGLVSSLCLPHGGCFSRLRLHAEGGLGGLNKKASDAWDT